MLSVGNAVRWCNFCNAAPSVGKLEAVLEKGTEPDLFDICKKCLDDIPEESWK